MIFVYCHMQSNMCMYNAYLKKKTLLMYIMYRKINSHSPIYIPLWLQAFYIMITNWLFTMLILTPTWKKNTRLSNSLHNHVNLSQNISSANKLVLIHFPLSCVLTLFWLFECVDTFLQFLHGFLKPFSMMLIKTKHF